MTFNQWLHELDIIFRKDGYDDSRQSSYTSTVKRSYWKDLYDADMSPEEAFEEHQNNYEMQH
jgi:hypothetical protein